MNPSQLAEAIACMAPSRISGDAKMLCGGRCRIFKGPSDVDSVPQNKIRIRTWDSDVEDTRIFSPQALDYRVVFWPHRQRPCVLHLDVCGGDFSETERLL